MYQNLWTTPAMKEVLSVVLYREPVNRSQRLLALILSGDRTVVFQASTPSTKRR